MKQNGGEHNMADLRPPKKENKQEISKNIIDIDNVIKKAKPKAATDQIPPDSIKPIQLKIPEIKKNEFKAYAAMRGRSMNDLFLEMFEEYKQNHS